MTGKRKSSGSDGTPSKKRQTITLQTKLDIIKRNEKGESPSQIGRSLQLNRSTIGTILKDKDRIREHVKGSAAMQSTIITKQRSGYIEEMEKLLSIWLEDQCQRHVPLCLMLIQQKAMSLYNDLKLRDQGSASTSSASTSNASTSSARDKEEFVASRGWFNRFKARANLHNIRVSGEAASADVGAAKTFPGELETIILEGGYTDKQIFNVDETGLYWKKMPNRTYISREKSMPGFKAAKDRLTLLLGANAAGDCKLKPLLVYHAENPRAFKGVTKASLPVIWKSNPKAWVTQSVFEDWFYHFFVPQVEKYCSEKEIPFKILLLLDNAPGHPPFLDDFHRNIKVVYMPPNTTSLLQPMDQGVIASFKAYYLRRTFAQALSETEGEDGKTLKDFWKAYNIYQGIKNIAASWNEIKETNLNGVWKTLCPQFTKNFKGFVDPVKNVTERIVEMGNQLQLEIEADDVTELLESHSQELTNQDLMELEAQKSREEVKPDEEVEPRRFTTKGLAEAFRQMEACLALFEEMDPNTTRFTKVSRLVADDLSCYKEIYEEKKRAAVQATLDRYNIFRVPQPTPSTSQQHAPEPTSPTPSTSQQHEPEPTSPTPSTSQQHAPEATSLTPSTSPQHSPEATSEPHPTSPIPSSPSSSN